jgi:hypothetical protein
MNCTARIRSAGSAVLLPAENAYDRELVFEEAEFAARHHGTAGLKIGHTEMRVACSHAKRGVPCAYCGVPVKVVSYLVGRQRLCAQCAKNAVS